MKAGGGRNKGNAFERKLANEVVTAFSCFGIKKSDCYRTPLSGGHIHAKQSDPGDLVISKRLRKYFPFHVEAKHYRQVSLNALFTPIEKQKKAWKFKPWVEQVGRAKKHGLTPVIVFKENNGPILAMLPMYPPLTDTRIIFKTRYKGEPWYVITFKSMLRILVKRGWELKARPTHD